MRGAFGEGEVAVHWCAACAHEKAEEKTDHVKVLALRLARVEAAVEALAAGNGASAALAVAGAASRAAEQVALAAGAMNARVEIATSETAKKLGEKLGEKLEETFTSVVAGAVEMHAEKIGARLNDQNQSRLDLAKETCASLTVLKNEMARITSDMATDVDGKRADVTPSGLARHSILVDYK